MRRDRGRRDPRATVTTLAAALLVSAPATAFGFCRTTTCDPKDEGQRCRRNPTTQCVEEGLPLFWPERCLSFGVQADGSPKRGISYETADAVIQEAFRRWMSVNCGGGQRPSFRVWDVGQRFGPILCNEPEFNENEPNSNTWMFRDVDWPYVGASSTLALTTITFEVPTGQILDADVEINSFAVQLTTTDSKAQNDLLSIATHEAGHFLGMAHSHLASATMYANYEPGDLSFRTLETDDINGICSVYPPDRDSPECDSPRPRHGFSRYCADPIEREGCTVAPDEPEGGTALFFVSAVSALAAWSRRRAARAPRRT